MDTAYWLLNRRTSRPSARTGIVRKAGTRGVQDDNGRFHPIGCTFMWAVQGSTNVDERPKLLKTLDYIAEHLRADYVRILGQVDWTTRPIDPTSPQFKANVAWFMDEAYTRGIRTQVTAVGGQGADELVPVVINAVSAVVKDGRAHKFMWGEVANEWSTGSPDKVSFENLERFGREWQQLLPDHLIALSCPKPKSSSEPEDSNTGRDAMLDASKRAGVSAFVEHHRRTQMEYGWDNVSQAYDQRMFDPYVSIANEPVGPQSSGVSEMRPLFLAAARVGTVMCSGAGYCLHPGQMVTGQADAEHGRPDNLWEVPGVADMMHAVRATDVLLPVDVEDWTVRNNARDDHPMPLPRKAFWSDHAYRNTGWVNKNYAAISENEFIVLVMGVRGAMAPMGQAHRRCVVTAYDVRTSKQVAEVPLDPHESFSLPGNAKTEAAYVLRGTYL